MQRSTDLELLHAEYYIQWITSVSYLAALTITFLFTLCLFDLQDLYAIFYSSYISTDYIIFCHFWPIKIFWKMFHVDAVDGRNVYIYVYYDLSPVLFDAYLDRWKVIWIRYIVLSPSASNDRVVLLLGKKNANQTFSFCFIINDKKYLFCVWSLKNRKFNIQFDYDLIYEGFESVNQFLT